MRNLDHLPALLILLCFVAFVPIQLQAQKVDIDIEKIREKCSGIPFEDRVRISVTRFNTTTVKAKGEFGQELATMLESALQQVNCFRVLESFSDIGDMTEEQNMGQMGFTTAGSSPQSGQMLGAQAILTGEVTEYAAGNGKIGALGITANSNKARIGFIIKVINPQTREMLWSRSVEAEARKPGSFSGVKVLGLELAGGSKHNTAINDAMERGIIKAVQILADEKDKIPFPDPHDGMEAKTVWDPTNCTLVSEGNAPSVMFIIPERHINRWLPDPNGEVQLISNFANAGFRVIDPAMYAAIRKGANFKAASTDPLAAASIGAEFGADVVIVGEGVSQKVGGAGGQVSCRATVNARAIRVSNAQILMSLGAEAGGADVSEMSAANVALRNAGDIISGDFLERFCTSKLQFSGGTPGVKTTVVTINKTDFSKMRSLTSILEKGDKVKEVNRTSFSGNIGVLEVKHEGSTDDIIDLISAKAGSLCDITGIESGEIEVTIK